MNYNNEWSERAVFYEFAHAALVIVESKTKNSWLGWYAGGTLRIETLSQSKRL